MTRLRYSSTPSRLGLCASRAALSSLALGGIALGGVALGSACGTPAVVPSTTSSATAAVDTRPPASPTWKRGKIAAGDDHTCAIVDQRVACWGHNEEGQMGDGSRIVRSAAQWVPGVEHATLLSAGGYHTCALIAGGAVKCWGGETTTARRSTPVIDIKGVTDAVDVASSTWMSCALTNAGETKCWGFDGESRAVTTTAKVMSFGAGYEHICLVEADGVLECSIVRPVGRSADFDPLPGITTRFDPKARVVLSGSTVCVLPGDGKPRVECTILPSNAHDEVKPFREITALRGATDLAAGPTEVCAAVGARDTLCFNSTDVSRIVGATDEEPEFKPRVASNLRDYDSIAIGGLHRCGTKADGAIDCWGLDQGQLGQHSARQSQLVPREVPLLRDAIELHAGTRRTCARRTDGSVACWGVDPASPRAESQPIDQPREIDGVVNAVSLEGGEDFVCATRVNGTISCWGTMTWRDCVWETGDKCHPGRLFTPQIFPNLLDIPGAQLITDRCALKTDNSIECLRFSQAHRLGNDRIALASGETLKGGKQIAGSCVLNGDGTVLCWGANNHGQLGDGSKVDRAEAASVKGLVDVVQIGAGDEHVCALLSSGRVRCWGDNSAGQLGDGTHEARFSPTEVPGLSNVKQIALGDAFTCALLKDGTAKCWGSNENGTLGDGSGFDQSSPVVVKGLTGADEIVAGATHACARLHNGTATCWGWSPVNQSVANVGADKPIHVALPK